MHPELAIEAGEGTLKNAWHGIMGQKNEFGVMSALGVIFWFHAFLAKETKLLLALCGTAIAFYCVLLSRSSTSLLSTLFSMIFMVILLRAPLSSRRYMPYLVAIFASVVVIYALAILKIVPGLDALLNVVASLTGKDTTFSNRSVIWDIVKEHVQLSPWFGSGYSAYWVGAVPSSPSYVFMSRAYFYPGSSHNGYLEIANDLGFVGLIVLLGFLVVFVRQSLKLMSLDRTQGVLYLGIFFQQAVINLSESDWLAMHSAFPVIIVVLATFGLARALYEAKRSAPLTTPTASAQPRPKRVGRVRRAFGPERGRRLV